MSAIASKLAPAPQEPETLDLCARIGLGEQDKFLSFVLAGETHALPILMVREIIRMLRITPLPQAPHYVRGIVNLRGTVIPVIDMRAKFDLPAQEDSRLTCIVVVQVGSKDGARTVGLVVDQVDEVLKISADAIEAPPTIGSQCGLCGVGKVGDKVVLIVDIVGLLGEDRELPV